jgi:hypothetical protein
LAARAREGRLYFYFESWGELIHALRERVSARFHARIPKYLPSTEAEWWALTEELAIGFVDFTLALGSVHPLDRYGRGCWRLRRDGRAAARATDFRRFARDCGRP